ncbi:MAG: glycosyltransferase family 4 protein [Planctomycetota bacterium]
MSDARRVLVVSLQYPPYIGGGYELLTRDAVEGLRRRGVEATVLTARGEAFEGEPHVLPLLAPSLDGEGDLFRRSFGASNAERFRLHFLRLANYRATLGAIDRVRPDVVLYFNLAHLSLAPVLAARHAGVPTLGYAADAWARNHWVQAWREAQEGPGAKGGRLAALEGAWRIFRGHVGLGRLLACSARLKGELTADGLAPESVGVLWPAVTPALAALAPSEPPARRAPGEPLRVLCSSSFWEGKGQHVLLKAASRARARGAAVEVTLAGAGEGEYADYLRELAREPELDGAVRFAGRVAREELAELLRGSHALATPSLWSEPFGMVTSEALTFGLPVLGSDAGATPEILAGGGGLVLTAGDPEPWCDALFRLAGDEDRRHTLALEAYARAPEFSEERFLDAFGAELERASGTAP